MKIKEHRKKLISVPFYTLLWLKHFREILCSSVANFLDLFAFFLVLFLLLCPYSCLGQTFGKNKVGDRHFEWMTYKTVHFTIYYYPDAESLVRTMADMAEIAYGKISEILEHDVRKPIPLILYKSHHDFQQTNVILDTLEEGVGGFSELLKYRVVIPFTGSMKDFQRVITHEVTHVFQFDILYKGLLSHIYTGEFLYSPPIWFIEGLSEYMAGDWNAEDEMVLRDAVITDSVVPLTLLQDFDSLGARVYLGYKEGQSAITYLVQKYGIERLPEILRELAISKTKDMDSALKNSIGIGVEEFDKDWREHIKEQYWPEIGRKQNPNSIGTNLTKKDSQYNNVKPVWSPSGDLIAYIASQDAHDEIRIVSAKDGKLFSKLTDRIQGKEYESIRKNGNGLAWSPDGDKIAFVGTQNGMDSLLIVDVLTRRLKNKIKMPFDMAYSPSWAMDNERLVIIGLKNGRSDIYVVNTKDGRMTQITSDVHDESSVSWHPSEPKLAYSSERNGRYKIFILNLDTQQSQQVTYGIGNDISPSWSPDGRKIVFCSDLNASYDVYMIDVETKDTLKLTNILTGCFSPLFSPLGDSIVLSIYRDYKNDVYVLKSSEFLNEKVSLPSAEEAEEPLYVIDERGVKGVKYSLSFTPDLIFVNFGYTSGGTLQNIAYFIASDMMGDHRLLAGIDFISIQSQPDAFLAYYYMKKRPDLGIAMFNWNEFHIEGDNRFWQRSTGIEGYLSYPFDKFNRADLQLGRYLRFRDYFDKEVASRTKDFLTLFGISFVKDTAVWSDFGPYSGTRCSLSFEQSVKLSKRDAEMTNIILDFRRYSGLGRRSNFAIRLIGAGSLGRDKESFYLGSSFYQSQGGLYFNKTLMRGYDFDEIFGNRVGLLNLEIRIPFIDELRFGWPFTFRLSGIRGVLFWDFAGVWPRPQTALDIYGKPILFDDQFKPWVRDSQGFRLVDLRSAIGAGFRIGPFSFDFAKKTDLRNLGKGFKFHFGIGQEF